MCSLLLALVAAGCGGRYGCGGNNDGSDDSLPWAVIGQDRLNLAPGGVGSALVTVRNQAVDQGWQLTIKTDGDPPTGWTVTGSSKYLDRPFDNRIALEVTVRVPANAPTGSRSIPMLISDDDSTTADYVVNLQVVVGAAATTSIRETAPFVSNGEGTFESSLEISNGEAFPITTMVEFRPLNFTADVDALVWFSPNSGGFSVDPGDIDTMKCKVLPRTNSIAKTFSFENYFYNQFQNGKEHKYATQVAAKPPTAVYYTVDSLDWLMGVSTADPDKTTTYDVTFDPVPTGKAGLYTFSQDGLNASQYTATFNPPNAPVNSNGDPVSVTVTVSRIGSGAGETVDEFVLRATHDAHSDVNARLRLPIRTYVGR